MNTEIYNAVCAAVRELVTLERPDTRRVRLLVVGCSTSEIAGGKIGKASVPELGNDVASAVLDEARALGIDAAFQCCEHLNRASAAYRLMNEPVLVESIQADAGLDIGCTLIGMHLKSVAIPIRLSMKSIGEAALSAALTRPKLIGGERAHYTL